MDYIGLALFSVVGTQVAGDAGFNIVGCALVGCVAGLGGRTINNLLYGNSSPLLNQLPGVFWARNPSYLAVAIGCSLLTFFAWPLYCEKQSVFYLEDVIGKQNLEEDGSVGKEAFIEACDRDGDFLDTIRTAVLSKVETKGGNERGLNANGTIAIQIKPKDRLIAIKGKILARQPTGAINNLAAGVGLPEQVLRPSAATFTLHKDVKAITAAVVGLDHIPTAR